MAAVGDELRRLRRARRLRVCEHLGERPVREAGAPGYSVVSPHARRRRPLSARHARAARRGGGRAVARALGRATRRLARVRRPCDRPAGLCGLVCGPAPDVELPGALSGRVLRQPQDAGAARPPALANRARRLGALRRSAHRALARAHPARRAGAVDKPPSRPRAGAGEGRRAGVLRRGGYRDALRPGARDARRRVGPRARAAPRDPVPAQRGGPAQRPAAAPPPPPGPRGPIRLLTNLRSLGHCFNPVSFYFSLDGGWEPIDSVVAEVTNTPWGERHAYVLVRTPGSRGRVLEGDSAKLLHVSPFMGMDHRYTWRVSLPAATSSVHIESHRGGELAFDATLALRRRALTARSLASVTARYPFATLRILALIYAHALGLKLRGVTVHPHPEKSPA